MSQAQRNISLFCQNDSVPTNIRLLPLALAFSWAAAAPASAQEDTFTITRARSQPSTLAADPASPFWKGAPSVVTSHDRYGKPVANARTEVFGRWTGSHLHFLFVSQFEKMRLKFNPSKKKETWGIWDYDVVEIFIGHDLKNINRYKEFEITPQSEWVDLDCDRDRKGLEVDWEWDAGMQWHTRVDEAAKRWYAEVRIPWKSIAAPGKKVRAGDEFRLNLYRIEGEEPNRKYITWRPVNSPSYHTPSAFGRLKLAE